MVKLNKAFLLELYCYSRQGERSIAFGLGADWSELREYYRGERSEGLRNLAVRMGRVLDQNGIRSRSWQREEADRHWPSLGLLQYLFGKLIVRWKTWWSFSEEELSLMAFSLHTLLQVLELPSKPDVEALVDLRMNLCLSNYIIEKRGHGLPDFDRARWLEHFYQADWITPVRMADILGEHSEKPPTRKSA